MNDRRRAAIESLTGAIIDGREGLALMADIPDERDALGRPTAEAKARTRAHAKLDARVYKDTQALQALALAELTEVASEVVVVLRGRPRFPSRTE